MTPEEHARITAAIATWFDEKAAAALRSRAAGRAQEGRRAQVTGGGHLAGFEQLVLDEIANTGASDLTIKRNQSATLAGWYRSTKNWDLLILQADNPILAVEFKSMEGSEGKNLNNRADEMFGVAEDARQAEANGVLSAQLRRAFVFIMESNPDTTRPVGRMSAHGAPDPIFDGLSYLQRMGVMLYRMRDSGLYHLVWAVGAVRTPISFVEPYGEVGWDRFSEDLRSGFASGRPTLPEHP